MLNATDLKNGAAFLKNGKPYRVVKYSLIKMGRGGATVKLIAKNLENGATENISLSSNVKVEELVAGKRRLQYLYKNNEMAVFMDETSFEQVEIPIEIIGAALSFLKEGESVDVLFWEDKALSIDIPPKVTLKVTDTEPGVKGNSVSNLYKPATLENGLSIKVPLFIKVGDIIRVDTRTAEYVERATNS